MLPRYGVPELLDGTDADLWKDEQSMVTYLCEMMKRLPETGGDASAGPLAWIDAAREDAAADLARLCSIPSALTDVDGCGRCADAIAAMCEARGLRTERVGLSVGKGGFTCTSTLECLSDRKGVKKTHPPFERP